MKRGLNKRIIVFFICISMFLFCTGYWDDWFGWDKTPNLINADKPFIDLSGSVGDSIGSANSAYEKAKLTPIPTEAPEPSIAPEPTQIPDETPPKKEEVRIVIGDPVLSGSGEKITVNDQVVENTDKLYTILTDPGLDGKTFILVDYYAETAAFKAAEECVKKSGRQYETVAIRDSDIDAQLSYVINK